MAYYIASPKHHQHDHPTARVSPRSPTAAVPPPSLPPRPPTPPPPVFQVAPSPIPGHPPILMVSTADGCMMPIVWNIHTWAIPMAAMPIPWCPGPYNVFPPHVVSHPPPATTTITTTAATKSTCSTHLSPIASMVDAPKVNHDGEDDDKYDQQPGQLPLQNDGDGDGDEVDGDYQQFLKANAADEQPGLIHPYPSHSKGTRPRFEGQLYQHSCRVAPIMPKFYARCEWVIYKEGTRDIKEKVASRIYTWADALDYLEFTTDQRAALASVGFSSLRDLFRIRQMSATIESLALQLSLDEAHAARFHSLIDDICCE